MNPNNLILLSNILLIIPAILLLPILVWVSKAKLPKNIVNKYSWKVVYMSSIPFAYAWKHSVNEEDLVFFEKHRTRAIAFAVFMLLNGNIILFANVLNALSTYMEHNQWTETQMSWCINQLRDQHVRINSNQ
ncbi:MAG: hypothetical protein H0W44_10640 [Gammaproteobacteria bacterium]|nr:hypothetical protein [Gammaproteobacteria bacterium]